MAKITPIFLDVKYNLLRGLCVTLYALAVFWAIIGIMAFGRMTDQNLYQIEQWGNFIIGIFELMLGFICVFIAQLTHVLMDMEWNQREQNALLEQVIKNQTP